MHQLIQSLCNMQLINRFHETLPIRRGKLLNALTAKLRCGGMESDFDFKRAKKTGQSIIPAENGQKQKLYVAVVCETEV